MAPPLSDEVWQQLNPRAGKRRFHVPARLAVVAVLLYLGSYVLWATGVVVPHLVWYQDGIRLAREAAGIRVSVVIANHGLSPVTLLDAGRSGPGLSLVRVDSAFPVTLNSGRDVRVDLVYRIIDCDAAPRGRWPVTAVVERVWGALTVDVQRSEPPYWQESLVDFGCGR